jgi:ComF family protein
MPVFPLHAIHDVIQEVLDLLLPPHCALCKHSGNVLCPSCKQQLQPLHGLPRCYHCHKALNKALNKGSLCSSCLYSPLQLNGLRAYANYEGALRSCIHALKYDGQVRLAQPLGSLLTQTYSSFAMQADCLVPLPLHSTRQKQRGYNQATLLARVCSQQLGLSLSENLVFRYRETASQVGLTAQQRQQNVLNAFYCPTTRTIFQRRIIIIDDVCTTGATLEACARTLFQAGASSVWGLVLARPCLINTL